MFFAFVFKRSNKEEDEDDDLTEDDEESYEVKHDEVLLHDTSDAGTWGGEVGGGRWEVGGGR